MYVHAGSGPASAECCRCYTYRREATEHLAAATHELEALVQRQAAAREGSRLADVRNTAA